MKKILLSVLLAGAFVASATAAPNDITLPIISNVFTTAVSQSSATQSSVRLGLNTSTAKPAVILNVGGYAPVVLSNTAGHLTYNGVAITTDTFVGDDMAIVDDLTVGDDAAISGALTVAETIDVNGVVTVGKLDTGYGQNELFDMDQHVLTTSAVSFTGLTNLGKMTLFSRNKAALNALTPVAVGEVYFCSDCSPAKIVVSTGTAAANFADAIGGDYK